MEVTQPSIKIESIDRRLAIFVFASALVCLILLYKSIPIGLDWMNTYRPAALAMARGESPYSVPIYYAAPWGAALLIPFALLPYTLGRILLLLVSFLCFAFIGVRRRSAPGSLVLILTSAAVAGCLNNGNIEFLPLLAIVAPPWLGLILIAIKPQVGVGLALFWAVRIWKEKGFRAVFWTFLPVSLLLIISFALYGFWPLRFEVTLARSVDNTSLFPWSVPIGLFLLWKGIRIGRDDLALASSPLLSPYVLQFTWISLLVYFLDRPRLLLLASVALWIPVILRVFF